MQVMLELDNRTKPILPDLPGVDPNGTDVLPSEQFGVDADDQCFSSCSKLASHHASA
jgi:hypothetical protein